MSKGIVYVMTNSSMPGIVKIGMTTRTTASRAAELYQTGVPTPFEVYSETLSPNCKELEASAHYELRDFRISKDREFFACDARIADEIICKLLTSQLNDIVYEYSDGKILVHPMEAVSLRSMEALAVESGVTVYDIVDALGMVTSEEIRPALLRHMELRKEFIRKLHSGVPLNG